MLIGIATKRGITFLYTELLDREGNLAENIDEFVLDSFGHELANSVPLQDLNDTLTALIIDIDQQKVTTIDIIDFTINVELKVKKA